MMKKLLLLCCFFMGITTAVFAQSHHTTTVDPVEKAKGLQKQLKLTDDQTAKIAVIYQGSAQKFDKIKMAEHGNTDKMLAAIGPLRAVTIKKIKAVLTPAQAARYDVLIKGTTVSSGNGWSDGWSPASTGS